MTVKAFSDEWAHQFKDEVNKSSVYKAAAKGWKWTVGLVIEAEPDKNFPEPKGVVMDLFDGEARDIKVGTAADAQGCNFVITAPYSRWKQVATGELDARVGIWVTDIDEGVTLDFRRGHLVVHNGLEPKRDITIRTDADTVMNLSNLKIGLFGMPVYYDEVGRGVASKMFQRKLRID